MSSESRQHLSVNLPPNHLRLDIQEASRYSQSFTIAPSSLGRSNSKYPKSSKPMSPFEDVEAGTSPMSSNQRDRFGKLSDLWMLSSGDPGPPDPRLSQWQPLRIEKRRLEKRRHPRQSYDPDHESRVRRRLWYILFFILLLLLLLIGNIVFLNIRILSPSATTSQTASTVNALSADAQECLSRYTLDAPSTPRGYPCSTCTSVLQAVPSSYTSNSAHTQITQLINSAVQFCSLRAILRPQMRKGKRCSGTVVGLKMSISALGQLTYPGIPASLPNEIGGLAALQTLEIIGGNATPAGSLPGSITNLTSLTTLHLEATSITALPNSLFASPGLTRLSTIALIRNAQMGTSLPSSLTSLAGLQSLLVNSQVLSPSLLATLAVSSSLAGSLHILDLTSTSLTGSIPSAFSSFKSLSQLLLGSNNLTGTVPTFPSTLQILELDGNAGFDGSIACTSISLTQCSVEGTAISVAGCNVCENATTTTAQ